MATCPDGRYRSEEAFPTYSSCAAVTPRLRRAGGVVCSYECKIAGSEIEVLGTLGSDVIVGVASVFAGPALRKYDKRKQGWPYGRSAVSLDVIPIGFGLNFADGTKPHFAVGPATFNLRLLRRLWIGAVGTGLQPAGGGPYDGTRISMLGPNLRLALAGSEVGFKRKGDGNGYYELFLDAGYAFAFPGSGFEGGKGQVSTAALGFTLQSAWMFGFGISTRVNYGKIDDAIPFGTTTPVDLKIATWDVIMAHILIVGL